MSRRQLYPPSPKNYDDMSLSALEHEFLSRHGVYTTADIEPETLLRALLVAEDAQAAAERRADDLKTELDWLRDQVERVGYQNPNSPPPVGKWYWDQEYNGGWVRQE